SRHGALLFRGFDVISVPRFEQFVAATSSGALPYSERSSPRSKVSGNIYTSTDYPASETIFLHNEQSYNVQFPLKIYFFCLTRPAEGGQTPIADTRRILAVIKPETRHRFASRGYMYVRNFGSGFGLSWPEAFQTERRSEVEEYCRQNEIECEWHGDRLRTRQVRRAIAVHPRTGEQAWFNHATFFHVYTLGSSIRERMLSELGEDNLPNNTYYGDGSRIEPEVMDHLRQAYFAQKTLFDWQQFDVLMMDNMLASHGREPFSGPRQIVAALADPFHWKDITQVI
ncbi:MAG TPA: TauD/TfdA family dioxygenase, partial [Pyrinomonadaceae bacterium]|nr:TauD/TfdA family dioxygenase [Pyrinomonadaceae bacterium]